MALLKVIFWGLGVLLMGGSELANFFVVISFGEFEDDIVNHFDLASNVNWLLWAEYIVEGLVSSAFVLTLNYVGILLMLPIFLCHIYTWRKKKRLLMEPEDAVDGLFEWKARTYALLALTLPIVFFMFLQTLRTFVGSATGWDVAPLVRRWVLKQAK